jgi:hypothetical protein
VDRNAVIDWLARLVEDGELTEADALDLLRRYDAGEIGDGWGLPLPPAEAVRGHDAERMGAAIGALLGLLAARERVMDQAAAQAVMQTPALVLRPNVTSVTTIQQAYERQVRNLAMQLAQGQITPAQWHTNMVQALQTNLTQQMAAGAGTANLTTSMLARLDMTLYEQTAYLSRFADQAALRLAQGRPLSEAYLANRAEAYGGAGRGLFYDEQELALMDRNALEIGTVVYYISRDDAGTCVACLQADRYGPYLPGSGHPVPGRNCLGRSRCRCRLEYRLDPAAYQRLTGVTP